MALPTSEQYKKCAAKWRGTYKGVQYELSHHGISDYQPKGTWCFYIFFDEAMFINASDFARYNLEPEITERNGSFHENFNYGNFPDWGFHGGITYYSKDTYVGRDGKRYTSVKAGCDYAHLWDRESGYCDDYDDVRRDAERFIDSFVENTPMKKRCAYSGKIDVPDNFYGAKAGFIHKSFLEKMVEDGHPNWLPEAKQ